MTVSRFMWVCVVVCGAGVLVGCRQPMAEGPVRLDQLEKLAAPADVFGGDTSVAWYDARQLPVEGKAWAETEAFFQRLPAKAKSTVPEPVWVRGRYSTGLCVQFVTDSTTIHVRWRVGSPVLAMNHMPASSVSGVDLYARYEGQWCWLGMGPPDKPESERVVARGLPAEPRAYRLYLPLYNTTESLEIGIDPGATLAKAAPRPADRAAPIVFYGTSIVHGGCCSRAGMTYPAILGRRLDRPVVNLGFSGCGKMEIELADLLTEIDAACYVIDCLPNMQADMVMQRAEPFVRRLRIARPAPPIVLVENIIYRDAYLSSAPRERATQSNQALAEAYARLKAAGVSGVYYVPGDRLLGDDHEATVDGTHPTDLGFTRLAAALEPVLRQALR